MSNTENAKMTDYYSHFEMVEQWFVFSQPLIFPDGKYLRGFFGNHYRRISSFHQHQGDKLIYRHPLIQYKFIGGCGLLTGLKEGAYLLKAIPRLSELDLQSKKYPVIKQNIKSTVIEFGWSDGFIPYRFITPWIALNEDNFKKYKTIKRYKKSADQFLVSILISNLISASKSLGYTVPKEIIVRPHFVETDPITVKPGLTLSAFQGEFEVNFSIPDLWGIGKFSSRGYGTVKKEIP